MLARIVSFVLGLACAACAHAAPLLTLKDGNVWLLRGTGWYAASAAGTTIEDGDAIDVSAKALAQVEEGASTRLQAVGPAGVFWAGRREVDGKALPEIGVNAGWVKIAHAGSAPLRVRASDRVLVIAEGVAVVHAGAGMAEIFVESGALRVLSADGKGGATEMKGGAFVALRAAQGAAAPRSRDAFVAEMPRVFRDAIPPMASRLKGPAVAAMQLGDVSFAEAQPWLAGPYRTEFMRRLSPRLADPAFREAAQPYLAQWPDARKAARSR